MLKDMQQSGIMERLKLISDPKWTYDAQLKQKDTETGSFRMLRWN